MKKNIVANWKMHKTRQEGLSFLAALDHTEHVGVYIAPPFTLIQDMAEFVRGTSVRIGAQNMSGHNSGAFTGEISVTMLKDVGASFVILGHSERRNIFLESDEEIAAKVERAVCENIPFILCVGEDREEKNADETQEVIKNQLVTAFSSLTEKHLKNAQIAYEPVWAIGTGDVATPQIVDEVHMFIQEVLSEMFSRETALRTPILYGGSVKPENFSALVELKSVSGALIGGASLDVKLFNQMIKMIKD
jgi:triosephosphate isomerase